MNQITHLLLNVLLLFLTNPLLAVALIIFLPLSVAGIYLFIKWLYSSIQKKRTHNSSLSNQDGNNKMSSKLIIIFIISFALSSLIILGLYQINKKHLRKSISISLYGPVFMATRIAAECERQGGSVLPPFDKIKGGGNVCSLPNINYNGFDTWPSIGQNQGKIYCYRTINNEIISGGTQSEDFLVCNVRTELCEYK